MSSSEGGAIHKFITTYTDGLKYSSLDGWINWLGDWGVSRGMFLAALFVAEYLWLLHLIPHLPLYTFNWLVGTAPIWLPIILIMGAWRIWMWYVQSLFLSGRNPILLEMKVPREITKSPRAMEIAFSLFSISSGETTFIHRAWKGQVRPFFSFEIASFGGELHFYIWTWKNYKSEVESAIYGQYPEVELYEVEDYATKFEFDPEKHNVFCTDWRLEAYHSGLKADSMAMNAYQPKTYIDFELDKDPKEEFRVDPLATVLEFMSNIEPQEQIWVQIIIRKCGKQGILFTHDQDHDWMHEVEHEVEKVRTKAAVISGHTIENVLAELGENETPARPPQPRATWKQTEQMKSMERHLGKYPFETGARGCYITTGHMHGPTYTGTRWLWKPLGNPNYMSQLRPRRWHNPYDYPWQDVADFRWNLHARRFFDAFRRRSFFHTPWVTPTNVLTNETLATLWHPPSSTVQAPGLRRIPSTKATAPSNLPK
jgi:hypothetical protein